MVKSVNMNLKVSIFPDDDMIQVLEQNIGNNRFVWNNVLSRYNELYKLFKSHGYPLNPNITTLNTILNMLKKENSFLREGESTSQQQTCRDLNKAFTRFFKNKSAYPRFKSRKSDKKSFRIAKNGNNIKISNRRIKLPKIGHIHYRTSKKYKKLLKTSKIYSTTIKRENGKYYAIINIKTTINKLKKTKKAVGIDLGLEKLATLSNGQEITNLNLKKEEEMIKKYQKKLNRKKYMSNNYKKTLKKYYKWINKKNNKIKNAYHQLSKYIVKSFDLISMENLNIKGMFKNKKWAHKLQKISLYKLINMIKYKSNWYEKTFIQINRFFPSSKKCGICGHINNNLKLKNRKWNCPNCGKHHKRDLNAAINILNEGIRIHNQKKINKIIKLNNKKNM